MRLHVFSVFALLFLMVGADITLARGSSSSRSSSSSFRSSSSRSSSSSSFSKPKTTPTQTTRKTTSTFGKKETNTQPSATTPNASKSVAATPSKTTPKADAPSKVSKEVVKRNAASTKKYGKGEQGRQNAIADYRKEQASKVTQRWDSEPSIRPSYVPNTISRNGSNVNVVFSNGGYGYYVGSAWTPLDYAMYMAVTDDMLYHHGYGNYGTHSGVVYVSSKGHILLTIIGVLLFLGVILWVALATNKN